MQKPTAPIFFVDDWPRRYVVAPRRSFSAWPMLSAMNSLPAPSGSLAVLPWYMSGASAVKPSAANRSHTLLMCPTSPHHSWSTSTPGPLPAAGVARYPDVLVPFAGNSAIFPAIAGSSLADLRGRRPGAGLRTPGLHLDLDDAPLVGVHDRQLVPPQHNLVAGPRDAPEL